MNHFQEKIEQMDEDAVRVVLSRAYHSLNRCEASMVDSSGGIQMLGVEDAEGYSRGTEDANSVVQRCQSRLNAIYQHRDEVRQGVIIHHLLSTIFRLPSARASAR